MARLKPAPLQGALSLPTSQFRWCTGETRVPTQVRICGARRARLHSFDATQGDIINISWFVMASSTRLACC
jgi:hypothetical protein